MDFRSWIERQTVEKDGIQRQMTNKDFAEILTDIRGEPGPGQPPKRPISASTPGNLRIGRTLPSLPMALLIQMATDGAVEVTKDWLKASDYLWLERLPGIPRIAEAQSLRDWLHFRGIRGIDLLAKLNGDFVGKNPISNASMSDWRRFKKAPPLPIAMLIYIHTGGAVQPHTLISPERYPWVERFKLHALKDSKLT